MRISTTITQTLEAVIGRLQHVYMQVDGLRKNTIETHGELAGRIAPDEFACYKHHFNNTVAFFHNDVEALTADIAQGDPEIRNILIDARNELLSRKIDDAHENPTDMRGYAETAGALADEIESKLRYLKGDDLANARELVGQLREMPDSTAALVAALENVITRLPPDKTIAASGAELHPSETQRQR